MSATNGLEANAFEIINPYDQEFAPILNLLYAPINHGNLEPFRMNYPLQLSATDANNRLNDADITPDSNQQVTAEAVIDQNYGWVPLMDLTNPSAPTMAYSFDLTEANPSSSALVAANFLIPITNHQDMVFDSKRDVLYITTQDGDLERFDLNSQSLLSPIDVGNVLNGADITPDGNQLVIAEDVVSQPQGFVHLVDLTTNAVSTVAYNLDFYEIGSWDIAVQSNSRAFVTTDFAGSGWTPLRELDLTTGTFTPRPDALGSGFGEEVRQNTRIQRSADRSFFVFTEPNISSGPIFTYDAPTDSFVGDINTNVFLDNVSAVNRNGSIAAVAVGSHLVLYDANLNPLHTLLNLDGGAIFIPVADLLYVIDDASDKIIAYETYTWSELTRFDIGENISSASPFYSYDQPLEITDDGDFLFVRTGSGIRVIDTPDLVEPTVILTDDFDPTIDLGLWNTISLGKDNKRFSGSDGNALYFTGTGTRQATTQALDVVMGGTVSFDLIFGTSKNGGENADEGDDVVLEYSLDGLNFTTLATYDTEAFTSFTTITEAISGPAQSAATQFRWRQLNNDGRKTDNWAIDNVEIAANRFSAATLSPSGIDHLTGIAPEKGTEKIDHLTGSADADWFDLGHHTTVSTHEHNGANAGLGDYARITNFSPTDDIIQLEGAANQYFLKASPISGVSGSAIYFDADSNGRFDSTDELIGIVQGMTNLSLTANYFVYV